MKKKKLKKYTQTENLICDWTDKRIYLYHYKMASFYVRYGIIVEKLHEIVSFKQSEWLENYISFITQKRNKAKNEFEKNF